MTGYVLKRFYHALLVLLGISLFIFFTIRLTGDPAVLMFQGTGHPSPQDLARIRHALGVDRPFWTQYAAFLLGILHGNFGTSFTTGQPVGSLLAERFPATLILASASMLFAILIAVPLGLLSAVKRGSVIDLLGRLIALIGISFPNFWLGIMFILFFSVDLRWFPVEGFGSWSALVLPSFTLGLILSSILTRLIRSSMLEVLTQQYVTTARSKGLPESGVILKHAFRNALIPTVTFIGLQFGSLLGGTVILEQVFGWPGLGRLALEAINSRDYPTVQASVLVLAALMVAINFLVDISYGFLDPRIRWGD